MTDLRRITVWDDNAGIGPLHILGDGELNRRGDMDAVEVPVGVYRRNQLPSDVEGFEIVATDTDDTHHHGVVDTQRRKLGHVRLLITPLNALTAPGPMP